MINSLTFEEHYLALARSGQGITNWYQDEENTPGCVYFEVSEADRQAFPELSGAKLICVYLSPNGWSDCNICEELRDGE